jgi:hypothetical protein
VSRVDARLLLAPADAADIEQARALSAWEPLLVVGGRELPTGEPQDLLDVLDYRGRYDSFPGALIGMKPPEFAVWMFRMLGAQAGDQLVDVYPGSGAVARAWDLYTATPTRPDTIAGGRVPGDVAGDAAPVPQASSSSVAD